MPRNRHIFFFGFLDVQRLRLFFENVLTFSSGACYNIIVVEGEENSTTNKKQGCDRRKPKGKKGKIIMTNREFFEAIRTALSTRKLFTRHR